MTTKPPKLIDRYVDLIALEPNLSNRQAADRLGVNPKTLVSTIHRARQAKVPGVPPIVPRRPATNFYDLDNGGGLTGVSNVEPWQQHKAARHLAGGSTDMPGSGARNAVELAEFLDVLGLAVHLPGLPVDVVPEPPDLADVRVSDWCGQAYTAGRTPTWIADRLGLAVDDVRQLLDQAGAQQPTLGRTA